MVLANEINRLSKMLKLIAKKRIKKALIAA